MIQTYMIRDRNLDKFYGDIAKLNKRAKKLGVLEIILRKTGEITTEPMKRGPNGAGLDPQEIIGEKRWIGVEVSGESPRYAGWTMAAVVEHTDEGNILRKSPDCLLELGQYRTGAPCCNHCNKVRNRRDTFIVQNDDGTVKQVGSNCLADFLGGAAPDDLAARAEFMWDVSELCDEATEEGYGGGGGRDLFNVPTFLTYVACARRLKGFITSKKAKEDYTGNTSSTAQTALGWMFPPKTANGEKMPKPEPQDREFAEGTQAFVIEKLAGKSELELSDFEHNMLLMAKVNAVEFRNAGLAAYLVEYRCRELEKELVKKAEGFVDAYYGTPKARVRDVRVVYIKSTGFDSQFGYTFIHTFRVAGTNEMLVWKSGSGVDVAPGFEMAATFTVKEHIEYNGHKQTKIARFVRATDS